MIGYASRTNTKRNVAALAAAGWGWIVGPLDRGGPILGSMRWALDNGAWPAFVSGDPWNEIAFTRAVGIYGPGADFIVVPDVVGDAASSLARPRAWFPELLQRPDIEDTRLLIAVQDGMAFADVEPFLASPRVGIFLGGSTEWKEQAIIPWCSWARRRGIYSHVGRVNTARRIFLCAAGGADSFDGTSATKFATTLPLLAGAARQPDMFTEQAA